MSSPSSGQFTLRITQTDGALTRSATSNVAPVIGSDEGCTAVVTMLVPTNGHIAVRFTMQVAPYEANADVYGHITVSHAADRITSDGLRMSGPFGVAWRVDYGYGADG